jgi:peroxiredoxin
MLLSRLSTGLGVLVVSAVLAAGTFGLAWSARGSAADDENRNKTSQATPKQPAQTPSENPTGKSRVVFRAGAPIMLTGRVLDEQGRPVAAADVRVRLLRSGLRPLRIAAEVVDAWTVQTDAEGRYRIDGVRGIESDDFQYLALDVNAPNYVEFCNLMFSDLSHAAATKGVLADVRLDRGVKVEGHCVGPDGQAVTGAKIRSAYASNAISSLGRIRTPDAAGHFQLNIPKGQNGELVIYSDNWAPRRVAVPAGGGDLGEISLEKGVEVIGTLTDPGSENVVGRVDQKTTNAPPPNGRPLAGKLIAFESIDRGQFGWFPITLACKTDRNGEFHVPALKGSFSVRPVRACDSGPDDRGPVVSDGPVPAILPRVVNFDANSNGARQELVLFTGPTVAIRGKITAADGKPAAKVDVMLQLLVGESKRFVPFLWTSTDEKGHYALTEIPRGLTNAYMNVHAMPPDDHSDIRMVASGRFQGKVQGASKVIKFAPMEQDQDPLDFLLRAEARPAPKILTAEDKELIKLGEEVDRLQKEFSKEWNNRLSPARQVVLFREKFPANVLANRFLVFAEAHANHPVAISALAYVFQSATGSGDSDAPIAKAREQAIDQVIQLQIGNPDIVLFFNGLQHGVPCPKAETLLRAAFSQSPHREVRAAACYELGRFLRFKADVPEILKTWRERPRPDDPTARAALEMHARNLERLASANPAKDRAEAEQLLERVGREFADVPQAQALVDGPGRVQISRYVSPDGKPKLYGALAEAALFELRGLAVGKPVPDIEGKDVDGQPFKLSDYRGKVIVLTFSGNWCGPCREMYPRERELVSRFKNRPFAVLSVNTDPERETLEKSIRDGEITWRCWWDGAIDGPISSRWNVLSFPAVFVIDAKGIIRQIGLRGEELDRAVERLMGEIAEPGKN